MECCLAALGHSGLGVTVQSHAGLLPNPLPSLYAPLTWQIRDWNKLDKKQTGWREQGWWVVGSIGGSKAVRACGREGELGRRRTDAGALGWCGLFSLEGLSRKAGLELPVWRKCFPALTHTGDGCLLLLSRHRLVGRDGASLSWGGSGAAADQSSSTPGTEPAAPSSLLRSCQQTAVSRLGEMSRLLLLLRCWFRVSLGTYSCAVHQFPFSRYTLCKRDSASK